MEHSRRASQHCDHGCEWVIQFHSPSGEVNFEVCLIEAEEIARKILVAVDESSKNLSA